MMESITILLFLWCIAYCHGFRILNSTSGKPVGDYFQPLDTGFVGVYGEPRNYGRERINEGAFETPTQELIFEDPKPRQACPGMVGPFSDGNYYCSAREFGYCDRRSGTCFCKTGYAGIDCSECQGTHYRLGNLCYPKILCEADCSGAGYCHFNNGTCSCLPHRQGKTCAITLCSIHHQFCESCTDFECLSCFGGYYITGNAGNACSTCYDFDPRCAGCTKEEGCTVCADPILTSVRRSGRREQDPPLPIEEAGREFSITLPFGTKSAESFSEAEHFFVATTSDNPLNQATISCEQGLNNDETWECEDLQASHLVCGHFGVFTFSYPRYRADETDDAITLTVQRSGGGHGRVNINYYIRHLTTNDSDLAATAIYTTSQKLVFEPGMVKKSFKISILDDNIVEEDEVFQVVLETPEGGGSVGAQFRTNVTIVDNDVNLFSAKLSKLAQNTTTIRAGEPFSVILDAVIARNAEPMTVGGERFLAIVENYVNKWESPGTRSNAQRHALRQQVEVTDLHNGKYKIHSTVGLKEQGNYQLRVWHAFPGGLKGQYYYDAFFQNLALERIDRSINFKWGTGRLIPRGSDYISIRWSGVIIPDATGDYYFKIDADDFARLWIDGELIIDHWQEQAAYMEKPRIVSLTQNYLYEIVLEYREVRLEAYAHLYWGTNITDLRIIQPANIFSLYEVDRSPVEVVVTSTDTYGPTTECFGDGLYGGTTLKTSYFTFCPRDEFGNLRDDDDLIYLMTDDFFVDLHILDDAGNVVEGFEHVNPMTNYNNVTHCFDGQFIPKITGEYRLDIKHGYRRRSMNESLHVAGSPFFFTVQPSETFGPYSNVIGLPSPLYFDAGDCFNFTIVARDAARNLKLRGGDNFEVYMYQVDYYSKFPGEVHLNTDKHPSYSPTSTPSAGPTSYLENFLASSLGKARSSPNLETRNPVVRYGVVYDRGAGNYTATLCPVIAGWHEIHVLYNAKGVSNQHHRILDKINSLVDPMGLQSFSGQYVDQSPYPLIVSHSVASAYTSTAEGDGVTKNQTVGVPCWSMVTVRDSWDNVMRTNLHPRTVSIKLDRSPNALTNIWDYRNGSYNLEYTANVSGWNLVSVYVNGMQISDSPFKLFFKDQNTTSHHSYAVGPGLVTGVTGFVSYFQVYAFDISNNRKTTSDDNFTFEVTGANNFTSYLAACPKGDLMHPICNPDDNYEGHYFGHFTPMYTGRIKVSVFLESSFERKNELFNSPFHASIYPSAALGSNSDIRGTLYSNVAGVDAFVNVQLRDKFDNKLVTGGDRIELALLGVAVEWGTIEPWGTTPGLPNEHHYRGFFAGYPDVYGLWVDNNDGSYVAKYNAKQAGQYVLRVALAESGLNATYFNTTDFGYLNDQDFNYEGYSSGMMGRSVNVGTTRSWTGDLGRRPKANGDIGEGSYYHRYDTRVETQIDMNLTRETGGSPFNYLSKKTNKSNFRQQYWSARWVGMITPEYNESYNFYINIDANSHASLYIGGLGNTLNDSQHGELILRVNASYVQMKGVYMFTDRKSREFVFEYAHFEGESFISLLWESPSTPLTVVPASAFSYWKNISHYNTTILPAPLCPHCSTAYGAALKDAVVAKIHSFVVYGRDSFGNLLQKGGDKPSMLAIGPHGVSFRGDVIDYGNSTYRISYYPPAAGKFRMFVTIGCCPPHPNIGLPTELEKIEPLLISGAPFLLEIQPAVYNSTRSIVVGMGIVGGEVARMLQFVVNYRDIHHNPTVVMPPDNLKLDITFTDRALGSVVIPSFIEILYYKGNATVNYNLSRSGAYDVALKSSVLQHPIILPGSSDVAPTWKALEPLLGSPFPVIMSPGKAFAGNTLARGLGLRTAQATRTYAFELQLFDVFNNRIYIGGNKLYIRLHGDATFAGPHVVTPTCLDTQNGRYQCSYKAQYSGHHRMVIKLLNSSTVSPGGTGLTTKFFASSDIFGDVHPMVTDISPSVDMSWSSGYILPRRQDLGVVDRSVITAEIPVQSTGQAIRWDGYLVAPITDNYRFSANVNHANVSVYIDNILVFDSNPRAYIAGPTNLQAESAYEIYVVATVDSATSATRLPISVSLLWANTRLKPVVIPKYYFYDSAADIQYSPFDVTVS